MDPPPVAAVSTVFGLCDWFVSSASDCEEAGDPFEQTAPPAADGTPLLQASYQAKLAAIGAILERNAYACAPALGALLMGPEQPTIVWIGGTPWVNPTAQYFAAKALRLLLEGAPPNRAEIIQYLRAAEGDGNPEIRRQVIIGLGSSDDPTDWMILQGRLQSDPSVWVREGAAMALGRQADPASVPALCETAQYDPTERVRMAAIEAARGIPTQSALYCLGAALADGPPDWLRPALVAGIRWHPATISDVDYWNTQMGLATPAVARTVHAILDVYESSAWPESDRVGKIPPAPSADPVPALPTITPWTG
ncbi:MAG: HEAT repeat domain-containing protein [Deltaproteobacteria bacterium]|nr:HEAT repeat domain-containing protein [Deltaproteobacteria bacterium]